MRNSVSFGNVAAPLRTAPIGMALAVASAVTASAATYDLTEHNHWQDSHILTFANDDLFALNHDHHGILGVDHWHASAFSFGTYTSSWQETTVIDWGYSSEISQIIADGRKIAEAREAAGEEFAQNIITKLSTDSDGNTAYRISAPAPEEMSIHTPFHGQQVRDDSDTYVVEGELGTQIITFKGLDTAAYEGEQILPDPLKKYEIGDRFNLGEEVEAGRRTVSENARLFTVVDPASSEMKEMTVGIGYPMLEQGDSVAATTIIISDASGAVKEFDATDYIMDAERMAELKVRAGGDGVMPEDYLVIAISQGSEELLAELNEALSQPGAAMRFVAVSQRGARFDTKEPIPFGEEWTNDIDLGQQIIAAGPDYDLPLSKEFAVTASVNFDEDQTLDHEITQCEFLMIDAEKIENYDYYLGNLDGFSGPYPRDHNVIFATLDGTDDVIAVGAPYMWGINAEDAANGIKWTMTGSFENVALTMTPEELRQLTHGCSKDNEGKTPTPFTLPTTTVTTSTFGVSTLTTLALGGFTTPGGIIPGGTTPGGTTPGGTPPVSAVPVPPALPLMLVALGGLGLAARRKPKIVQSDNSDSPTGAHPSAFDTLAANGQL